MVDSYMKGKFMMFLFYLDHSLFDIRNELCQMNFEDSHFSWTIHVLCD